MFLFHKYRFRKKFHPNEQKRLKSGAQAIGIFKFYKSIARRKNDFHEKIDFKEKPIADWTAYFTLLYNLHYGTSGCKVCKSTTQLTIKTLERLH